MRNATGKLILLLTTLFILASCERMFTTSPLAALQRDPSTYSDEQKLRYAADALASGDREAMAEAYQLLSGSTDPETQLLAVDLAVGAAGVESVLTSALAAVLEAGDDPDAASAALSDALESFSEADLALLTEAGDLLETAGEAGGASAGQYGLVAVGLLAAAAQEAGGVDNLDTLPDGSAGDGYLDQAETFLLAAADAGDSSELLSGFEGLIPDP